MARFLQCSGSHFFNDRRPLDLDLFHVHAFIQNSQHTCLALPVDPLGIDIRRVNETRIQDSTNAIQLATSNIASEYFCAPE